MGGTSGAGAQPSGLAVAVDGEGNVFIAGVNIWKVTPSGTISTIGGDGTQGYSGDGGPASNASFARPAGIAVNAGGDVYVADTYNHVIRLLRMKNENPE